MLDTDPPVVELAVVTDAWSLTSSAAWVDGDGGHGVEVAAEVPGPPPLTIEGERSAWSLRDGVVVFEGGVVARRDPVELACSRLEVQTEGDRVVRAIATGDLVVRHGDRRATAAEAVLTVADGSLVLTGGPVLEDGTRRLTGERLVLFLDDERLECTECTLHIDGEALVPR